MSTPMSTPGAAAIGRAAMLPDDVLNDEAKRAAVYEELRLHQSLASVMNDPRNRAMQWDSMGEFWESVKETITEDAEGDAKEKFDATNQKINDMIGPVPEVPEFQGYFDTFNDLWESYHRAHRVKTKPSGGRRNSADEKTAGEAHHAVPKEYFRGDFKVEQHEIFKKPLQVAIERQEEINTELTGYMDMIEISLFEHIRRAQRDNLFEHLAKKGEPIKAELGDALTVVQGLRGQLRSVQRKQLNSGRAVGRLEKRKRRIADVLQRLQNLSHVQQSLPSIKMLLEGQDYVTALDLLESTSTPLETMLKGLTSVKPGAQRIGKLGTTFDSVVEADFVHHSTEAVLGEAEALRSERLSQLGSCLARRGNLQAILSATLRDVFLSQLKKAVKTQMRKLVDENSGSERPQEGGAAEGEEGAASEAAAAKGEAAAAPQEAMSTVLCAMSFDKFSIVWRRMMQYCMDMAKRFVSYAVLVQGAAAAPESALAGRGGALDVSGELLRLLEVLLTNLLQKIGALLQARQGVNVALEVTDWQGFLKFSSESMEGIKALQDGCKQQLAPNDPYVGADVRAGVRGMLYNQTKSIVEEFTKKRQAQMDLVLEQERWERVEVPGEYVQILDELLGKKLSLASNSSTENQGVLRQLLVDGIPFMVVPCVLTLVQLLNSYVSLCRDLEGVTAEILQRMAKLLRSFNQKMHQLVLGGQAVSTEVLKRITAANLALCSQSCGLVGHILPGIQSNLSEIIEAQYAKNSSLAPAAPVRQMVASLLSDLTKIAAEYTDHRTAIFTKLSDLLRERYDVHAKKWLSTPHEEFENNASPWASGGVISDKDVDTVRHESLEGLVKDITNMYRQLLKNLTGESVRAIFTKAFETIATKFEQRLGQEIAAPQPPYEDKLGHSLGDRLLLDVAYLKHQLETLSGIATPLKGLLSNMLSALQVKLPCDDALKALHPAALEGLRRAGRLPR